MKLHISENPVELGKTLSAEIAGALKEALASKTVVNLVLASAASQIETLKNLVAVDGIDWGRVCMFHLDEYIGLDEDHPASFRKFLKDRFLAHVDPLKEVHLINGSAENPAEECRRLNAIAAGREIDVACIGMGENAHLAFNDPPADFEITDPFLVVELDEACRRQQLGEGWFPTLDKVPTHAISMSVQFVMGFKKIVAPVPDQRKAKAIKDSFELPITNMVPCTILQRHPDCRIYADKASASLLEDAERHLG